jgi:hypothetical protein
MAVRMAVALLAGALHASAADVSCLVFQGDGCHTITDETACMHSRDGRMDAEYMINGAEARIRDQACTWCGGAPCLEGSPNVCEPVSVIMAAKNNVMPDTYTTAACMEGATLKATLETLTRTDDQNWFGKRSKMPSSTFKQQIDAAGGTDCRSGAGHTWSGASPMDDQAYKWGYRAWTAKTLEECKGICDDDCTGVEWKEKDYYCEVWYDVLSHYRKETISSTSDVRANTSACYVKGVNCLKYDAESCRAHTDEATCLSQRNGREGQPCAWCNGNNCTNADEETLCIAQDELFEAVQDGSATEEAKAMTTKFAHCANENTVGTPLTPKAPLDPERIMAIWEPVTFPPGKKLEEKEEGKKVDVTKVAIAGVVSGLLVAALCLYCCKSSKAPKKTRAAKIDREVQPLMEQPKAREVQLPAYQTYQVAPPGVTGRYQYFPADFVEGARPFMDAPTVLTNVPPTLQAARLFRGPQTHQAGDSMTVAGPPGTMVHVILGESNSQAAKQAMHQAMTQQGWDYFDVQMAADGLVGHRIYLAQLQQPITISLSTPTSIILALTHTPLIPATYTPMSTPGSVSFPAGSYVSR